MRCCHCGKPSRLLSFGGNRSASGIQAVLACPVFVGARSSRICRPCLCAHKGSPSWLGPGRGVSVQSSDFRSPWLEKGRVQILMFVTGVPARLQREETARFSFTHPRHLPSTQSGFPWHPPRGSGWESSPRERHFAGWPVTIHNGNLAAASAA